MWMLYVHTMYAYSIMWQHEGITVRGLNLTLLTLLAASPPPSTRAERGK